MEQNAQRELRLASPEWSVSESMARIAKALVSDGPALAFGHTSLTHVPARVSVVISTTGSSGAAKAVGLSASAILASFFVRSLLKCFFKFFGRLLVRVNNRGSCQPKAVWTL